VKDSRSSRSETGTEGCIPENPFGWVADSERPVLTVLRRAWAVKLAELTKLLASQGLDAGAGNRTRTCTPCGTGS
jgi:hypothetical protein